MAVRLALVGMGKIAHDQHLPAIAGNPAFELVATVSRSGSGVAGVPNASTLDELLAGDIAVDAVALCTPPQVRYELAATALRRGLHVFLEKPPGATLSEVALLDALAAEHGVSLFASWHSRFAPGVAAAKAWLAEREVRSAGIVWREDVRHWHPGQEWIWQPGGLGVFDPGINALSILTEIMPRAVRLSQAVLEVPENRATPIAADLTLIDEGGARVSVDFDWRQTGPQSWDIFVETDDGRVQLALGGAALTLPGQSPVQEPEREYPGLYARFAELIADGRSEADVRPLRIVADAFLTGEMRRVEAFVE